MARNLTTDWTQAPPGTAAAGDTEVGTTTGGVAATGDAAAGTIAVRTTAAEEAAAGHTAAGAAGAPNIRNDMDGPRGYLLSEMSQEEKGKYHTISLTCGIREKHKVNKTAVYSQTLSGCWSPRGRGCGVAVK